MIFVFMQNVRTRRSRKMSESIDIVSSFAKALMIHKLKPSRRFRRPLVMMPRVKFKPEWYNRFKHGRERGKPSQTILWIEEKVRRTALVKRRVRIPGNWSLKENKNKISVFYFSRGFVHADRIGDEIKSFTFLTRLASKSKTTSDLFKTLLT